MIESTCIGAEFAVRHLEAAKNLASRNLGLTILIELGISSKSILNHLADTYRVELEWRQIVRSFAIRARRVKAVCNLVAESIPDRFESVFEIFIDQFIPNPCTSEASCSGPQGKGGAVQGVMECE